MKISTIDAAELADLLTEAEHLQTIDHDGQLIHVLRYSDADMLAIVNPMTGGAACIYPPKVGSAHQPARDEEGDAFLDNLLADL